MHHDPIVVLIRYRALPGREEAARRELAALIGKVAAREPDCLGITMLGRPEEPAEILLHELWTAREAYLGPHLQTPHLLEFIGRAPELFAGPPEITLWDRLGGAPAEPASARR